MRNNNKIKKYEQYFSTGTGKLNFESFCRVALHFNEEVDDEALQKELKEAFRLYDKEGWWKIIYFMEKE